MAYVIVWSEDAVRDIDEIAEYIARDSIHYAKSVASKLYTAPEKFVDAPFSGREVPEFSDLNIREIFIYSYRLIYRVAAQEIQVAAVIHGSRELSNATKDRSL
jgi:toxin ParE1/3/4